MKSIFFTSIFVFLAGTSSVFAQDQKSDLSRVRSEVDAILHLLEPGEEIAGTFEADYSSGSRTIKLRMGDEYLEIVSKNYIFADLNGDGLTDLAVAVESAATKSAEDGFMSFGSRRLKIFTADRAGALKLNVTGEHIVLSADDGGVWGDPLEGLSVNKKGSLIINHYGGSSDRWALGQTFAYRKNDFYLIGERILTYRSINLKGQSVETNLLTGDQIITKMRGESADGKNRDVVIRRKTKVKPLVKLVDAKVGF